MLFCSILGVFFFLKKNLGVVFFIFVVVVVVVDPSNHGLDNTHCMLGTSGCVVIPPEPHRKFRVKIIAIIGFVSN